MTILDNALQIYADMEKEARAWLESFRTQTEAAYMSGLHQSAVSTFIRKKSTLPFEVLKSVLEKKEAAGDYKTRRI